MNTPLVDLKKQNGVAILTLNRPEKFNCLSLAVHKSIEEIVIALKADNDVRCILICASGKNFCTGADLEEVKGLRDSQEKLKDFIGQGNRALALLENNELPVVVAVQGLALAGGLELVLATDIVFAAESAKLGDQHSHFGLIPGWGGSQRLPRIVGKRRALDLLFSARWLKADEALSMGLVNYVVPEEELQEAAVAYCEKLAKKSRSGLSLMKSLVHEGLDLGNDASIDFEAVRAVPALQSEDVTEGLAAFEGRREPKFA
ncbi:MAG: enoyl-CoA hydratase/isomerase family protein [Pseudomonadales bacterium]|nr:enoyl-CoA hydratase/isomerase family protein [Pseudomonadales bacterium]